ncbi:phosphatidylserine decarboxylase [Coprinopsis cinerea okayama7|uniref:Phosphatidylserine decarboxylase n=1 Tax=Coprinopsis cinerea (strain Okayama-7 / 130 / ATCC MYA-4618 / FGSC 9003) TaxID=240176 RepID=A8P528_COPC7|nr:phosphatidylserine decarboxylase [Coprinopsis cinerea okayama7\|eukprot:XP_001838864.1 phosphatidylserine decarboxylase [Coprinopsis cinerea okayama7\
MSQNALYSYAKSRTMSRYAGWLPSRPEVYRSFMHVHYHIGKDGWQAQRAHEPAVAEFAASIRKHPDMVALFDQIFKQVAQIPDLKTIKSFEELLHAMDSIVTSPPKFHIAEDEHGNPIGEPIGVPMYLLFDLLSNTSAGYDLFRMPAFNEILKTLLNEWGKFLTTFPSASSLHDGDEGWFSTIALQQLESDGRGEFNATYVVPNPSEPHRGYTSWDAFFTREVQPSARPILKPEDKSIIHSACESTVYNIQSKVKKHDQFWLKTQAYSLYDILNKNDEDADKFVGGTIYQAFLSPLDYHRWHAPVDGEIVKTVLVPGSYYAVLPDAGAPQDDPDLKPGDPHGALIRSQGWLTVAAARALIFIKADNPDIGLMCFVGIGMAEVSTCDITVKQGDKVKTGDQLGMFHFGGSSHALIFGPQTKITFAREVTEKQNPHLLVNSVIAQVSKAEN